MEGIAVDRMDDLSLCTSTIELCVVRLCVWNTSFFVVGIYRPHSDSIVNFTNKLNDILQTDTLCESNVVIAGDLNIDILSNHIAPVNNFISCLRSLHFLPARPTRFPTSEQNGHPSALDHIWVNGCNHFTCSIILSDITDHCSTFMCVNLSRTNVIEKV